MFNDNRTTASYSRTYPLTYVPTYKTLLKIFVFVIACLMIKYQYLVESKETQEEEYTVKKSSRATNLGESSLIPINQKLDVHVLKNMLKPPSMKPYNVKNLKFSYQQATHTLSWNFIHEHLKLLFDDQTSGFFIEAGALDGEVLSNTLWLEMERGWNGLLVEPDTSSYLALMKKNRKAWSINSCLSTIPNPQMAKFKSVRPAFYNEFNGKDFNWLYRGHSYNMDTNDNLNRNDEGSPFHYDYITVLCLPVDHLLKTMNVSMVDFFSLDIEGGELEVLELFPWDSVKLRTLVVEYGGKKRSKLELIEFMNGKGYILIDQSKNQDYIFVLKTEETLVEKVRNITKRYISN